MSVIDFKAVQKWNKLFCFNRGVTTIVDYSMDLDKFGMLLKGKCKKCGRDVERMVENE